MFRHICGCLLALFYYCLTGVVSGTTVRALVLGRFGPKIEKNRFERYCQKANKNIFKNTKGVMLWATDVCSRAAFLLLSVGRLVQSHWASFSQLG